MKVRILSFTGRGRELSTRVRDGLLQMGYFRESIQLYAMEGSEADVNFLLMTQGPSVIAKEAFEEKAALIFIGAAGICLRSIAPFIGDKRTDPPVLCLDEAGKYVIPILSGHAGGANRLARSLANHLCSQAVITTATDVNGIFAVDEWAETKGIFWNDKEAAKKISANLLKGNQVGFMSNFPVSEPIPEGWVHVKDTTRSPTFPELETGVLISLSEKNQPFQVTLNLIPKIVVAGIGCRKNVSKDTLKSRLEESLEQVEISMKSICAAASIDLKAEEPGLLELLEELKIPAHFYSTEDLMSVEGSTEDSDFVKRITGVGNVCERAALLASNGGKLLLGKTTGSGVTISLAMKEWRVNFEY